MRVYVAGAYSAPDVISVLDNMRRGMRLAYEVLKAGHCPFVPWFDYHFSLIGPTSIDEYYSYSMSWLEVSDCVLVVEGWEGSKGTIRELERARELEMPVYFSLDELRSDRKIKSLN